MNKIKLLLLFCILFVFGCNNPPPPVQNNLYSGYFKILLRNEINETHGEHTYSYKHIFVQGIVDTFLFADLSQYYYEPLTDSFYYVKKVGDIVQLKNIHKDLFIYGDKYFPMIKPQE